MAALVLRNSWTGSKPKATFTLLFVLILCLSRASSYAVTSRTSANLTATAPTHSASAKAIAVLKDYVDKKASSGNISVSWDSSRGFIPDKSNQTDDDLGESVPSKDDFSPADLNSVVDDFLFSSGMFRGMYSGYDREVDLSKPRNFTIGYLTGSERLPEDQEYKRPGLLISGALTLAMDEINSQHPLVGGHRLTVSVTETYGREQFSILGTATLWTTNVSVYIGPQETCVYEAKLAAAFGIPMLSYMSAEASA